ncbi:CRISPR-associated RAMP Cmr4 family protein family protein [Gloeomargarita lithophora Alchichica-D10]|uniref:CRISPR-associated RAMP Cmr4 family protein family protein n=1 Tax=Gloeomargarita lithophora Alchichica-D10 TaxID=1188229 RepID=A0A1J0AAJ7_9CYAN|nr:type III-B CRISPR module RAMP protein Cmr4 [Gloeomargarita lithophora]APB32929.1 CRISPR-associated RAMP Cmr4 family protein family protein [Gloeomargarita lithophora Alchichica-D10]
MYVVHLILLSPLHTGGTTQEGNLLGIARESHTNLPYIPSSTIRGRLRSSVPGNEKIEINGKEKSKRFYLFGNEIADGEQLEQGAVWIGDGSILWIPVPSLSHGVVWVTSPMLLRRWVRLSGSKLTIPAENSTNIAGTGNVYLKDAILKRENLSIWNDWEQGEKAVPGLNESGGINHVLVLADKHCATIVQMSLWRQVKVKLDEHKTVDGGFRYEEAIPPDALMYFPWGITAQANGTSTEARQGFEQLLQRSEVLQIGGQESLGRGFVQLMIESVTQEGQS